MQNREKTSLVPLKTASTNFSISYNHLCKLVRSNKFLGVYRIGGRYKVDLDVFKLNFNKETTIKVSFEKLRRYFETESAYWGRIAKSTADYAKYSLKLASEFFIDKEFTKHSIELWKNYLKAEGEADGTVRKRLSALSKMCNECVKVGLLEYNVCKGAFEGLKKVRKMNYLTKEERERLLKVCYEELADNINFAIETGLRQDEQFSLNWDRVFFKEKEVLVTKTKTHTDRVVPLSPLALHILEKNKSKGFSKPFGRYIRKDYIEALKKANIAKNITWHDLRRTFAMWSHKGWHEWATEKCNLNMVGKFLGHKDVRTTSIYADYDAEDLHKLIKR